MAIDHLLDEVTPKGKVFSEVVSKPWLDFLGELDLGPDMIPEDAERAQLIRFYVLARSSCLLVHLDMVQHCPEMVLANMVDIPVIGVTEKYNLSPMVRGHVDMIVNPTVRFITAAVRTCVEA